MQEVGGRQRIGLAYGIFSYTVYPHSALRNVQSPFTSVREDDGLHLLRTTGTLSYQEDIFPLIISLFPCVLCPLSLSIVCSFFSPASPPSAPYLYFLPVISSLVSPAFCNLFLIPAHFAVHIQNTCLFPPVCNVLPPF